MDLHIKAPLLATILFLIAIPDAFAQGIIVRGGMNFANAVTDPEVASSLNPEFRKGLNAALLAEFGNNDVSLLIGAGYENKGMHLGGSGGGDIRLDYLTLPVMVSFGTHSRASSPRLFANAGIEPAFLLSSDYATENFTYAFDNAEGFDFCLRGEVGAEFPFSYSGPAAVVGVGYTFSLTDANSGDDEWRNHVIHLFVGLKIRTF
jgi:hypothetical protein